MPDTLRDHLIETEPYFLPTGQEVDLFTAAHAIRMPVMLKGPTGSGKTRFVEHMAWRLRTPLVTVACHEDMTAADLVGRYLLNGNGTVWEDGPLTRAVRHGGICYLDEIVEARQDTTVVIHPLTDGRAILPLEKKNELVRAHPAFHLVISYNPGYQSVAKDLKESTKQRFAALDFTYPGPTAEARIIRHESGVGADVAQWLVRIGEKTRNLKGHGLDEGASTRMLVQTARLHAQGIPLAAACETVLIVPLTDDIHIRDALSATVAAVVA
ncbi:CbbQ/NirQ/NorQ/GpvN family protein [Marinibacterium sp. SX1]|uniref:CbbQ/NirQ/NorQ/GpvN family protein n=1 Tax=Marinibacterium sp. SX1 TaxID=3388424 RepID=UPI003D17D6B8